MEDKKYMVSAIISTYNSEEFMKGCLENLELQTIADKMEIIVINSGSEQDEEQIVKDFQERHQNIRYIKIPKVSVYTAWNVGIKMAKGKYVTNANTDDRHKKDFMEIMVKELEENPKIALVYADQAVTKIKNETFEKYSPIAYFQWPEFDKECLLNVAYIGPQPVWRKELHDKFGYFDEKMIVAGDYEFWLRIAEDNEFKHISKLLGLYLDSPNSVEHSNIEQCLIETKSIRELYKKKWNINSNKQFPLSFKTNEYKISVNGLVSVIMRTYNRKDISKAVLSILNQSYTDWELLIINDGGKKPFIDNDDRIKYIEIEHKGAAGALNEGLKFARGKYIAFLDDDDYWHNNHLDVLYNHLNKNRLLGLVYGQTKAVDEKGKELRDYNIPKFDRQLQKKNNLFTLISVLVKKECFNTCGQFDETLITHEDYDMWRRIGKYFWCEHIPMVTSYYVQHESLSRNQKQMMKDLNEVRNREW